MLEKPAPKKLIQVSTSKTDRLVRRYASDLDSSWFRKAYGSKDGIEMDGTDYKITRNLLDI